MPPLQQHALLELQSTAMAPSTLSDPPSNYPANIGDPSSSLHVPSSCSYSAASFLPVLKLLTGSASHDVSQLAGQLLTRRIVDLLGGAIEDEVALWLGLLPKRPHGHEIDSTWIM